MQTINLNRDPTSRPARRPRLSFGLTWLIILPALLWGISDYYLPLLGGVLTRSAAWTVTAVILLLVTVSLFCHVLAHAAAARLAGMTLPAPMALLIFGDAAQRWPVAAAGRRELLVAIAGPLVNLLLAGLAYLVWATQTDQAINLIALFLCGFNLWMFVINLIPAFPFDGGRIFRLSLRGLTSGSAAATRRARLAGLVLALLLAGWGVFLILQHSRFSPETGLITFLFVLLVLDGLRFRPAAAAPSALELPARNTKYRFIHTLGAALLCLVMLAAVSALALTNNGLDAPGVALSVGPMVKLPAQYRHAFKGQLPKTPPPSSRPDRITRCWIAPRPPPSRLACVWPGTPPPSLAKARRWMPLFRAVTPPACCTPGISSLV